MTTSYHINKDIGPQCRTMYYNKAKYMKFQQSLETEQCFVSEVKDFLKTRGLIHYQIFVKIFVKICLHKHILRGMGKNTTVFCPKLLNLPTTQAYAQMGLTRLGLSSPNMH